MKFLKALLFLIFGLFIAESCHAMEQGNANINKSEQEKEMYRQSIRYTIRNMNNDIKKVFLSSTLLHTAQSGDSDLVEILLSEFGANPDFIWKENKSILDIIENRPEVSQKIKNLLSAYSKAGEATDIDFDEESQPEE